MRYPLEISTEPTAEPLTTAEAKTFFREDRGVEDSLIDQFVGAARKVLERHTGYVLVDTVFDLHLEDFVDVKIPKKPFKAGSVTIYYDDTGGTEQTLATSNYAVHSEESPVSIEFLENLPDLDDADDNRYPVRVEFTAGYGAQTDVPDDWKSAVGLVAMYMWVRGIPEDPDQDFNPLNLGVVQAYIIDYQIGRFK